MPEPVFVRAGETSVFVRELDRPYPLIVKGEGVWLEDADPAAAREAMALHVGHSADSVMALLGALGS